MAGNVSRVCEVAEKGAEYFLLPKTNLVKKDIILPENQQFRINAVSCSLIEFKLFIANT